MSQNLLQRHKQRPCVQLRRLQKLELAAPELKNQNAIQILLHRCHLGICLAVRRVYKGRLSLTFRSLLVIVSDYFL